MSTLKFSRATMEHLGHYVYALVDPLSKSIFYVGKASANSRAFDHLKATKAEREKEKRVRSIRATGLEPLVEILRYGLPSVEAAHDVEAALIDALGLENLTNVVRGHGIERGRLTAQEAERLHGSQPVRTEEVKEPCMLFFINQTYSPTLTEQQLYDSTRQFWYNVSRCTRTPDLQRKQLPVRVALAVVDSVVVRAYSIVGWFPAGATFSTREFDGLPSDNRWEFVGNLLTEHPLLGKRLTKVGQTLQGNEIGYGYINNPLDT